MKETKLLVESVLKLGIMVIALAKDGIQAADLPALIAKVQADPALVAAMSELQAHYGEIPAEVKEITLVEGVELAVDVAEYIPQIIAAFKAA